MGISRRKWIVWIKIILGGALFAVGFQFFLLPNDIVIGGVSGLSMIIHRLTDLPTGALMILINVPLFILAWRLLGRETVLLAVGGVLATSVLVDVLARVPLTFTRDMLLAAVYGGVLMGAGLGVVFSAGASTGGSDLAARMLRKKYAHLQMGQIILAIDFCVVALGAAVFRRYDSAMYALITIFLSSRIVDLILYGAGFAKVAYIVSDRAEEIRPAITVELDRGLTVLRGEGGYSGRDKTILMCAIKQRQQIVALKRIVYSRDPSAFIIIHEAREVVGQGFDSAVE